MNNFRIATPVLREDFKGRYSRSLSCVRLNEMSKSGRTPIRWHDDRDCSRSSPPLLSKFNRMCGSPIQSAEPRKSRRNLVLLEPAVAQLRGGSQSLS
jgi:hypothetical protein